jgi:hypothetical protein
MNNLQEGSQKTLTSSTEEGPSPGHVHSFPVVLVHDSDPENKRLSSVPPGQKEEEEYDVVETGEEVLNF